MFAVYAMHAASDDPLSALQVSKRPEPNVPAAWVPATMSDIAASRHRRQLRGACRK
jgi:hypothetical protein